MSMLQRKRTSPPRFIQAKRAGVCPETGKSIAIGDQIAWFPETQKAYHCDSQAADGLRAQAFATSFQMADANY